MGAHSSSHNQKVMFGVKGEMVVGKDKLGKLDKELSRGEKVGRAFVKDVTRAEIPWGWGMLV